MPMADHHCVKTDLFQPYHNEVLGAAVLEAGVLAARVLVGMVDQDQIGHLYAPMKANQVVSMVVDLSLIVLRGA